MLYLSNKMQFSSWVSVLGSSWSTGLIPTSVTILLLLERYYCLSTNSVYIKFVWLNLKVSHCCHVCKWWLI